MLNVHAIPLGLCSNDYQLRLDGRIVGGTHQAFWTENGDIALDGRHYRVGKAG